MAKTITIAWCKASVSWIINCCNGLIVIRIENKFSREKTTRLASELSGEAGLSDIVSWKKVTESSLIRIRQLLSTIRLWSSALDRLLVK